MREREREEVRTTNEHAAAADPAAEAGMTNEQAKNRFQSLKINTPQDKKEPEKKKKRPQVYSALLSPFYCREPREF